MIPFGDLPLDDPDDRVSRIIEEFTDRLNHGEQPLLDDYLQKYPDLADTLQVLLSPLMTFRQARSPHGREPTSAAVSLVADESIAGYRIVREIGQGGMARVYLATHTTLRRHVALKVLSRNPGRDNWVQRFEREARAASALHHSHIVPIFDAGKCDGVCYIAMQYIAGNGLDDVILTLRTSLRIGRRCVANGNRSASSTWTRAKTSDSSGAEVPQSTHSPSPVSSNPKWEQLFAENRVKRIAAIGCAVADALEHAHRRQILHRDVKPSNLLLDARGHIWVTDFGLAKTGEEDDLTATGDVLGTLRYMAPERFDRQQDARSDVYSLGVTLYELLTLQPAFDQTDRGALIRQILEHEPPPPDAVDPTIPRDLSTIVAKSMVKDPNDRYESAQAMAEDLTAFLSDLPIRTRRLSCRERFSRWRRRNPKLAALSSAVVFLVLLLASVSTTAALWLTDSNRVALQSMEDAIRARDDSTRNETLALELTFATRVEQARASLNSHDVGRRLNALQAISQAAALIPKLKHGLDECRDLRNQAIAAMGLADVKLIHSWKNGHPDAFDVNLKHCANWNAPTSEIVVSRFEDNLEVVRLPGTNNGFRQACFTADGRHLVTRFGVGANPQTWNVWEIPTGRKRHEFEFPYTDGSPRQLDVSSNGSSFVVLGDNGELQLYDIGQPTPRISLVTGQPLLQLRLCPDERRVAASRCLRNGWAEVQIWDLHKKRAIATCRYQEKIGSVSGIAWSHDGRLLATGVQAQNSTISLWNPNSGERLAKLVGHAMTVDGLVFVADSRLLVSTSRDGTTRVWDVGARQQIVKLEGDLIVPTGSNSSIFGVFGYDAGNVWKVVAPSEYQAFPARSDWLESDGRLIAYTDRFGVCLADALTNRQVEHLPVMNATGAMFRSNELFVQSAVGIHRWPLHWNGTKLRIGPPEAISETIPAAPGCFDISRDGRVLAIISKVQGEAVIEQLDHRAPPVKIRQDGRHFLSIALSCDGRIAATGTWLGSGVRVWDTATGQRLCDVWPDSKSAKVQFSPDGRLLVAYSRGEYRFWLVDSWEQVGVLDNTGKSGEYGSFAFSADGRLAAFAFGREEVGLFTFGADNFLIELSRFQTKWEKNALRNIALSPRGRYLLGARFMGHEIWNLHEVRERLRGLRLDWSMTPFESFDPQSTSINVEIDPKTFGVESLTRRIDFFAESGQWGKAVAGLEMLVKLDPENFENWADLALARFQSGDVAGYTRACGELLDRFGAKMAPIDAYWTLHILVLAPQQENADRILGLADIVRPDWSLFRSYLARGFSLYYFGKCREAAELLLKAQSQHPGGFYIYQPILAMALQKTGESERATKLLADAEDLYWKDASRYRLSWQKQVMGEFVLLEAQKLVDSR